MDGETGQLVWSEEYSTLNNERVVAGAVDAAGNLLVVGRAFGDGFYDIIVQMYHGETGSNLWSQQIASPVILDDVGWDVAVDSQGRVAVCGMLGTSPSEADATVALLDPTFGETIWQRDLPGAINNIEVSAGWLAVADNDDIILGTRTWESTTGYDLVLTRLAAADGADVWAQRWNSGGTTPDDPRAMVQDASGRLIMSGVSGGDYLVAAFDAATGDHVWDSRYAGPPDWYDVATCVTVAADGSVIASGYSDGSGTGWDMATVAFDGATGAELWAHRFDGYTLSDEACAVAVSPTGDVAVVGYAYSYDAGNDAVIVYYDAGTATGVDQDTPQLTGLTRAYPNPFNPSVTVRYRLANNGPVNLDIVDARGRKVASLVGENQMAGMHEAQWQGRDQLGRTVPSGVYLAVLRAGGTRTTQKLMLVQ